MSYVHTIGRALAGLTHMAALPPSAPLIHALGERRRALSGPATLAANTVIAGLPDSPVAREVELIDLSLLPARQTAWSAANGEVEFARLPPGRRYLMVSYDHTGVYDPVAKLVTIPTPLPEQ